MLLYVSFNQAAINTSNFESDNSINTFSILKKYQFYLI